MPKLCSARTITHTLKQFGFDIVSQKGSHMKLRGIVDGKLLTVIVPNHKEIALGTFKSILTQANLTKIEFESKL